MFRVVRVLLDVNVFTIEISTRYIEALKMNELLTRLTSCPGTTLCKPEAVEWTKLRCKFETDLFHLRCCIVVNVNGQTQTLMAVLLPTPSVSLPCLPRSLLISVTNFISI